MTSILEDLPNELLFMIFSYLSLPDLLYSLSKLNNRFDHICDNLPMSVDFNIISNGQFNRVYRFVLRRFTHSVLHLRLSNNDNDGKIGLFLEYFKIDNFPNLRTLELYKPDDE